MKQSNNKHSFCMLFLIILFFTVISLFVWDEMWHKVIFGSISVLYILISLHKFNFIVLKDRNKQLLVSSCWNYATSLWVVGYIVFFLEELLG